MWERVLILGTGPLARRLAEEIEKAPLRYRVVGFVDEPTSDGQPEVEGCLGPLAELDRILSERKPDRVIVALTVLRGRLPIQPLLRARVYGIAVEDGVDAYERLTGKVAIEALPPSALIFSPDFRKDRFACRALSVVVAAAGLVVLSPLLLLVALAIVLDSEGPVFFLQDRIGALGRRFKLIKFRTMHPAAGRSSEWEKDNGHRITRVGRWLRRFRLDELPQFVNVLRGDMNLVGPRPHPVSNYRLFVKQIPYYPLRSAVRPGITGWAQVRYGYANNLEEETEKMRFDLHYVKHLSLWLDIRILFETVRVVLGGQRRPLRLDGGIPPRRTLSATGTGRWKVASSS